LSFRKVGEPAMAMDGEEEEHGGKELI
jgi:hypothetical protein